MIRYLKEGNQNKKELLFIADNINKVYEKMLGIVVEQYHRKTSYKYNESDETALIGVELELSEVENEELREKEAEKFIDWFNVVINEVVIDDYSEKLKKKL